MYFAGQKLIDFSELKNKTFEKIFRYDDAVFFMNPENNYVLYHDQDCCEDVYIEDISGDLSDLVGHKILVAEASSQNDESADESATWTFFKLTTLTSNVTIRFYGSSNGYYSEDADLYKLSDEALNLFFKAENIFNKQEIK